VRFQNLTGLSPWLVNDPAITEKNILNKEYIKHGKKFAALN